MPPGLDEAMGTARVSLAAAARRHLTDAAPQSPEIHLLETADGRHLFVVDGSRLFDIVPESVAQFEVALSADRARELLAEAGLRTRPRIDDEPLQPLPIHALSLAVAQKCNLGCT